MDFRMASSPSAAAAAAAAAYAGLLPPPPGLPPHHHLQHHHPLFYYPGLPSLASVAPPTTGTKITPPSAISCPPSPGITKSSKSYVNNHIGIAPPPPSPHHQHHRSGAVSGSHSSSSSSSSSSSATVVSPPSSGTATGRHQPPPHPSSNGNGNSSSSSSSSFAAALRHLAKQAGGPADTEGESMRSPSRSNYAAQPSTSSGGIVGNGYAHSSSNNFGSERVKSPSPIITSVHTPHRSSTSNRSKDTPSSRSTSNGKSSRSSSHRDDVGHHSSSSGRSRSPPVVTIAPTLNSGLHYQDSRKAYDRAMLCHTVPSSGSFNGGLSTGLSGAYSATPSLMTSSSNNSTPGTTTGDYRAPPDMSSYLPPYASYLPPRDDLFYGGLRNSMQQSAAAAAAAAAAASSAASTTHYRPEENSLGLIPPRTSYHESLLGQIPTSRPSSSLQEEYLMAARNSNFNPYSMSSGPLDHSSLHQSLYSNPYAQYRSLEEQMYLERYGLLRPGSAANSAIPPYPPMGYPSYLNFRYPSPMIPPADLNLSLNNEATLNRMKLEEEQRAKERIREEELAAVAKSQEQQHAPHRPLATVTPREQSSNQTSQERKERDRQREKKRERDELGSRKNTVQLPNESSSGRGVKVHTVSPLYTSYPMETAPPAPEMVINLSPIPPAVVEEVKRCDGLSSEALENIGSKQRSPSPVIATSEEPSSVPLDLSETSVRPVEPKTIKEEPVDVVRSLLDLRVERWKRKRSSSNGADDVEEDDIDEDEANKPEFSGSTEPSLVSLSVEQCLKSCTVPAGVSEEQHHFLHMFGLVTPKKRSEFELVKCIRRQNILREPTPPPIDSDEEDSATALLKHNTRLAANVPTIPSRPDGDEVDPELIVFAAKLNLNLAEPEAIENVEKAWSTVVADRMKRHFGQKQGVRKRLWGEAFRPLNFDQPSDDITSASETSTILKPVPQQPILRSNNEGSTTNGPNDSSSVNSEASKLTSEVAFWLRHLKPTMARTLTAAATTGSSSSETPVKQEELSPPEVTDNNEVQLTRWPGTDSIMVLYMAHQQELLLETKFLREHCERLHLQLAEGQATLSKLCLTLSSSVESQRRCQEEDASTLQSIKDLQETLKLLQSR